MYRRTTMFLFCSTAATLALTVGSVLQGCGSNSATSGSVTSSSSTGTGTGGGSSVPTVTVQDVCDPTAPGYVNGVQVQLKGLVATSIKFEVSKSKTSGSCLWGVFLSAPGISEAQPYSGLLAVNDGTPASAADGGTAYCPVLQASQPAGDLFPDDTLPGDVFDIVGLTGSYVPSTCGAPDAGAPNNSNVAQYQLSKLASVKRTARGAMVPAPHVLTTTEAASLAAGDDPGFLNMWGGARVTVQNVTAVPQAGGLLTDAYGHLLMNDGLQVGDKMFYVGYVNKNDACFSGPVFGGTGFPTFQSITGYAYLDYCTWGLAPADKCHDLNPTSGDCASALDAGPDANPGMVCEHPVFGWPGDGG